MSNRIDEIRERRAAAMKAQPEPWRQEQWPNKLRVHMGPGDKHPVEMRCQVVAEFVAHAPDDIAYLLGLLEAANARRPGRHSARDGGTPCVRALPNNWDEDDSWPQWGEEDTLQEDPHA